jgi:hypothetical protein
MIPGVVGAGRRRNQAVAVASVSVIGGSLVVGGSPVAATSFVVDSATDDGTGGLTLREAIVAANAEAGADTITFDPSLSGSTITLQNGLRVDDDLTIVGLGESALTVASGPLSLIVYAYRTSLTMSDITLSGGVNSGISAVDTDLTLSSVTLAGSKFAGVFFVGPASDLSVTSSTINDHVRRGLYVQDAQSVTITDSTISGNGADGFFASNVSGDVLLARSDVSYNTGNGFATSFVGGNVAIDYASFDFNGEDGVDLLRTTGELTISAATSAQNGRTGIRVRQSSGPVLVEDTAVLASAGAGGMELSSTADVTVSNSELSGSDLVITASSALADQVNVSGGKRGGMTFDSTQRSAVLDSSVFDAGSTGIQSLNSGPLTIQRSTVSGSEIAIASVSGIGPTVVRNSTLTANGSQALDHVIMSTLSNQPVAVAHSTISANGAQGEVIFAPTSPVTVDHTILTDNAAVTSIAAQSETVEYSLVPNGSGFGGTNIETDDPMLGVLADNGGPTQTMLPRVGSPAIDAGSTTADFGGLTTDQRGSFRFVGPIDIGATELSIPVVKALAPARLADTRSFGTTIDGRFANGGKRSTGTEMVIAIAGRGGVPSDAEAAVVNVTAVGGEGVGFVTVHPCVTPRPLASSLNFAAGTNIANEIVAPLSATGEICVFTSAPTHLLVDVVGFVPAGSSAVPLTPTRYLDTRSATGETFDGDDRKTGKVPAGSAYRLAVAGRGEVPANASAAIVNVTAVGAAGSGFVTVDPCGDPRPLASSLNFVAGVNRANELVASLDANGEICLFVSASVDLVVDVVGYLPVGSSFDPFAPARLLDTRPLGATVDRVAEREGKRSAGSEYALQVAGRGGVPSDARAVVVNVTAVGPESVGFVTVHPCLVVRPVASSLNYVPGVNGANELIAQLDVNGRLCLFTDQRTDLIVDVVGVLNEAVEPEPGPPV